MNVSYNFIMFLNKNRFYIRKHLVIPGSINLLYEEKMLLWKRAQSHLSGNFTKGNNFYFVTPCFLPLMPKFLKGDVFFSRHIIQCYRNTFSKCVPITLNYMSLEKLFV